MHGEYVSLKRGKSRGDFEPVISKKIFEVDVEIPVKFGHREARSTCTISWQKKVLALSFL